jgi:hypothetical protein
MDFQPVSDRIAVLRIRMKCVLCVLLMSMRHKNKKGSMRRKPSIKILTGLLTLCHRMMLNWF